jgi:hypothetical protein
MLVDLEVDKSEDSRYGPYGNLTDLLDHKFQTLSKFINLGSPNTFKSNLRY